MTQHPPGPGQPWQPSGPAPWETGRQQQPGQPPQPGQQQRPMPPPMPMPMYQGPAPVTKPSIWRITLGVYFGLMLFFITIIVLAAIVGNSVESNFDSDFNFSLGSTAFTALTGA